MKSPLILITPLYKADTGDVYLQKGYLDNLKSQGAVGVMMPLGLSDGELQQLCQMADGFLFTGGPDIASAVCSEKQAACCGTVAPYRDDLETRLFPLAYQAGKPIFGICRGAQLINVCMGGTLYQDLPAAGFVENKHTEGAYPEFMAKHPVFLEKDSPLFKAAGCAEIMVNSYHHQAVRDVAPGLSVAARDKEGVIEAVYAKDRFLLGVQWHPERAFAGDLLSEKLWQMFVSAAKER